MDNNVLRFYLDTYALKNVIRTGWNEVGISCERLESVAEHIYGCLILILALDSEKNLDLDILKVIKMTIIKELEKVTIKEFTTRNYLTSEERKIASFKTFTKLTENLIKKDEMLAILDEYNKGESKEAKFVHQLSKIESDIQAKIYDLEGYFDLNNAKEDAKYYGEPLSSEIIPQMQNASDGWILYDRRYYQDDIFKELSETTQNLNSL